MKFYNTLMELSAKYPADQLNVFYNLLTAQAKREKYTILPSVFSGVLNLTIGEIEDILLFCSKTGYVEVFGEIFCSNCSESIETKKIESPESFDFDEECPLCGAFEKIAFDQLKLSFRISSKLKKKGSQRLDLETDAQSKVSLPTQFIDEVAEKQPTTETSLNDLAMDFFSKLIVGFSLENSGFGSGILTSPRGLIVSCFHNFYIQPGGKRILEKLFVRRSGVWQVIDYRQNVLDVINTEELPEYARSDLFLVRLSGKDWLESKIEATNDLPKEGTKVWIAVYDSSEDNKFRVEKRDLQTIEPIISKHPNRMKLSSHGYKGWSGGGVFTLDGKLCGVLNLVKGDRLDEPICSVPINHLINILDNELE